MSVFRHPIVAVSHGPGPLWLLATGFDGMNKDARPAKLLLSLFDKLYPTGEHLPKRILLVSAHFESDSSGFEISNAANPEMIYDYYGLPDEAYDVVYPARGDPAFAQKVKEQLEKNNLKAKLVNRGFDHGAFVPMALIRPQADIPVVNMSINSYMSNQDHFNLGKAIARFRDEDTLIICSGQSTHNLRGISSRSPALMEGARAFQSWLDDALSSSSSKSLEERTKEITTWQDSAPAVRLAHPSPDHFMPFVVAAGAGMEYKRPGAQPFFGGWGMGPLAFANYAWGIQQ
jgi:4,5-DOPA dioxygenase extradiol